MDSKLLIQAITKFICGVLRVMVLIFVPAWSLSYWQGWLLMGILFIPMLIAGLIMFVISPDLLRKRLNSKEKEEEQKTVIILSIIMFILSFIVAGFNYRYNWILLPDIISYIAALIFLVGYILYAEVLRENAFLSRTIEVQENQVLIDSGLYGVVRHPMYMSTLILFLAMPLVLGSIISFVIMLAYIPIIAKRIRNEEEVLEKSLNGYMDYKKRIKYKLIPFIW